MLSIKTPNILKTILNAEKVDTDFKPLTFILSISIYICVLKLQ